MPFLRRLIVRGGYNLVSHYSGLPSLTPAVQAEIFYGARCAVPGFVFYERHTDTERYMLDSGGAAAVEATLNSAGSGLMHEGSSYSNIFTGGAVESHFCASSLGWKNFSERSWPFVFIGLVVLHVDEFIRILCLALVETWVALWDMVHGTREGIIAQIKQIPRRVAICSVLRDWCTLSARIDMARGLPVIHVNFLGYDEQSHRRGPHSRYAHWTLTGIDTCIRKLCRSARRGDGHPYRVWIYSDHGQESVIPYREISALSLDQAVHDVFGNHGVVQPSTVKRGIQTERASLLQPKGVHKHLGNATVLNDGIKMAAKGPVCHIYLPAPLTESKRHEAASALCGENHVPMVAAPDGATGIVVWTKKGQYRLPEDGAELLGDSHPFLSEVTDDLIKLVHHPNAGDMVLFGYVVSETTHVTFANEYGAHAGPGANETHGFILAPPHAVNQVSGQRYLRPASLRALILQTIQGTTDRSIEVDAT